MITAHVAVDLTQVVAPDGATVAVLLVVIAEGPDDGLVGHELVLVAGNNVIVEALNLTGVILVVEVLGQHVEHLAVGAVGAALKLGDGLVGVAVAAALQRVVIDGGIGRERHLHVGVLHTGGQVGVHVGHHLVEGVVALHGRGGLQHRHLNAVGALLGGGVVELEHITVTGGMVVVGSVGCELVNKLDVLQVQGCVHLVAAQRAIDLYKGLIVGMYILGLVVDLVGHLAAVHREGQVGNGHHHVIVGGIIAEEREAVLTVLHALGREGIHGILVGHAQVVAVVVHLIVAHVVALIVLQVERQEVVPAGDDHVGLVGPCYEHVMLAIGRFGIHDVSERVAVQVLRHLIGVSRLAGNGHLLVHLVAILIGEHEIEGIGLGHALAGHLVERRGPVEDHVVHVLGSGGLGITLEDHVVDTHLGCIVQIVLGIIGCQVARVAEVRAVDALVGVHRAAVNAVRAFGGTIVVLDVELIVHPVLQAVVGDEDVHARQRLVLGAILARHRELMLALDNRCTVVDNGIQLAADHLGIEIGDLRALATVGGAELLKHALEGHALTGDDGIVIVAFLLEHPVVLLA